jgi:hypothetical protein
VDKDINPKLVTVQKSILEIGFVLLLIVIALTFINVYLSASFLTGIAVFYITIMGYGIRPEKSKRKGRKKSTR